MNNKPTTTNNKHEIILKPRSSGRTFAVLAQKCHTTPDVLATIIKGEKNRIKECLEFSQEETIKSLQNRIFGVLELYTSAPVRTETGITDNARQLIAALMNITISKFSFLSVDEIKQAFDLAALDGLDLSTYYGKITVTLYIKVLKNYVNKRNLIRQEYDKSLKLLNTQSDEDKKNELNAAAVNNIIQQYTALVAQYISGEKVTIENIPYNWGENLNKIGRLNVELSTKQEIKKEALKMAISSVKRTISDAKENPYTKKALRDTLKSYLNKIAEGGEQETPEKIKALQLSFYKKLVVLESIKNDALEQF
jgi:hypothetical protein